MTDMKSIRFPAPAADDMVRAILEDRKTVTRRVVKPQPVYENGFWKLGAARWSDGIRKITPVPCHTMYNCAPYRPGDILYVRETWAVWSQTMGTPPVLYYRADLDNPDGIKWHPSIHMPREAARIFLRVTDVRVERLQEITDEQAQAEGVKGWMVATDRDWDKNPNHLIAFRHLWNSTIKKADRSLYGWDANPYVWVIEFERCEKPKGD